MPDLQGVEKTLESLNRIVTLVNPLAGVVATLGRSLVTTLRKNGQDAEAATLEAELNAVEAKRVNLRAALDEFHAKFPPAADGAA